MSWPDRLPRRTLLAGAMLALAGCALTPVHAPGGAATALFGQVRPTDPRTPEDFAFNRRLAERLGPEGGRYTLAYSLRIAAVSQAENPEEVTTRHTLNGTADYTLTDPAGQIVAQGQTSNFTGFSTTGTTVAALAADADARMRLAVILADQVVTRLIAAVAAP